MKIVANRNVLTENIDLALKAISTRTTLPILECLLLTVDEDGARFIGNDLNLGIETHNFDVEVYDTGSVALNAKMFSDIIRRLPAGDVTIMTSPNNLTTIKSGRTEFKIVGQNGQDYPILPVVERNEAVVVLSSTLKNMIQQTIFAVSTDETKPTMNGELLTLKDGVLKLAASDGFRVSTKEATITGVNDENLAFMERVISVLIPSKTLSEIGRILPNDDTDVYVYITDKHAVFEPRGCTVVSRLIEGAFINYEAIFLQEATTIVTVNRIAFGECVERASLLSRDVKKTPVKLSVGLDRVAFTSFTDFGNVYDEVSAQVDGLPLEIAFSPRFFLEALKSIAEEEIIMQFTTPLSPCIIMSNVNREFKHLIVPLRLRK